MKNFLVAKIFALMCVLSLSAHAEALSMYIPGNIAIHIAKRHYEHPVRLLHPYLDVWHMKGPLVEKVVQQSTLKNRFKTVSMCNSAKNADVVLLIEPQMFYNAQLRIFYAEIIAKAYTNSTEPPNPDNAITTIKEQAQQLGELGIKPEFYMEKAYTKAMNKVIKRLVLDKAFLASLSKTPANNAESLCSALDDLPVSKVYY